MRNKDQIVLESIYAKMLKESMSAKELVKILARGSKEKRELVNPLMGNAANYTNDEGVEVSIKDNDTPLIELNGEEYAGDIELNYIGLESVEQRNKGAASRELDRIMAEADKHDLSISLTIDPHDATSGGGTMGLTFLQLKQWYKKRGFIFNKQGRVGYRPKKSENREEIEPKMMLAKAEDIPKIEEEINYNNGAEDPFDRFPKSWSDEETLMDAFYGRADIELLKGYHVTGEDYIFYYDGVNRPIMVNNLKADYDFKKGGYVVHMIEPK